MIDFDEIFAIPALECGWFRFDSVELPLQSGRVFRYQLNDYPFRVDASVADAEELAAQVVKDKYRYCQWDRDHPQTNQELEIFHALKNFILDWVAKAECIRLKRASDDDKQ